MVGRLVMVTIVMMGMVAEYGSVYGAQENGKEGKGSYVGDGGDGDGGEGWGGDSDEQVNEEEEGANDSDEGERQGEGETWDSKTG